MLDDRDYMARALGEARDAGDRGEVPVGAVLVGPGGDMLASAGNAQIGSCDATAHAEVRVLQMAGLACGNYRLPGTVLFVTLEPCTMCCGALIHARVERLVFATREPKAGAVISTAAILENPGLNHRVTWSEGLMATESAALLSAFFAQRRKRAKES
jgi:tRNA(adenine34) deaminase